MQIIYINIYKWIQIIYVAEVTRLAEPKPLWRIQFNLPRQTWHNRNKRNFKLCKETVCSYIYMYVYRYIYIYTYYAYTAFWKNNSDQTHHLVDNNSILILKSYFDPIVGPMCGTWKGLYLLSETLAPLGIMGGHLRAPPKPLYMVVLWCTGGFTRALNWAPWFKSDYAIDPVDCTVYFKVFELKLL